MTIDAVRDAYGRRYEDYIEFVESIVETGNADRELMAGWADGVDGPLLDVGCGPGQWTDFLSRRGADISGLDVTPEFITAAQERFPDVAFMLGSAEALPVESESLAGVLAWYSLIHASVAEVQTALDEFARVLRPGGSLLLGFFAAQTHEAFDHAVTTAYFWPVRELAEKVRAAGLHVAGSHIRTDTGARTHGDLIAVKATS